MIVLDLLEQPYNKFDNINKVVTSCQQVVLNMLIILWDKQSQHNLLACRPRPRRSIVFIEISDS